MPAAQVCDVGATILVAEDDVLLRIAIAEYLRDCGFRRARTFSRIGDLLNAVKEETPALLIASDDLDPSMFDAIHFLAHHTALIFRTISTALHYGHERQVRGRPERGCCR